MARSKVVLSGAALAIAADLLVVGMNGFKAQRELDERYEKEADAINARTQATNIQLMNDMFDKLEWPREDMTKWAIDVRYADQGFAILVPIGDEAEAAVPAALS